MRLKLFLVCTLLAFSTPCFAQAPISELEPEQYFDFWVGEWELSWTDQQGNTVINRMIFHDIKSDSFTWDWQSSSDGGKTWQLNWQFLT